MLLRWLSKLDTVHIATTAEEREAIYRFRYTVYVEELGRILGNVDHEGRRVADEDDERDFSVHLYTGSPENVTGSIRLRRWQPGEVPEYEFRTFNMSIFPNVENLRIAELGRLMIRPSQRGGRFTILALARAAYENLAGDFAGDIAFCYCAPGLVRHYRKLGFRLYPCPLVPTPDGMHVGMVLVGSDAENMRRVGSPCAGLPQKYYDRARRQRDRELYASILVDDLAPLEADAERVWSDVATEFMTGPKMPSFLESLSPNAVRLLSSKGFIIDIEDGTLVTKTGYGERELFVILDGTFEVLDAADRRVALLGKGDLFGEVAFFRESGRRSATVRAAESGRVLMLRRHFLDELMKTDPKAASQILFNLGRILSDRLASMIQERQISQLGELDTEADEAPA